MTSPPPSCSCSAASCLRVRVGARRRDPRRAPEAVAVVFFFVVVVLFVGGLLERAGAEELGERRRRRPRQRRPWFLFCCSFAPSSPFRAPGCCSSGRRRSVLALSPAPSRERPDRCCRLLLGAEGESRRALFFFFEVCRRGPGLVLFRFRSSCYSVVPARACARVCLF